VHPKPEHTPLLNEEEVKRLLEGAKMREGPEGKRLSALLHILYATNIPVKDVVSLLLTVEIKEQLLNIEPYLKSPSRALEEGVTIQKTNKKLDYDGEKLLAMTVLGRESYSKTAPLDVYKNENWVVHLPVPTLEALQEYLKVRNYFLTHGEESPWLFPSLSQKGHLTRQRFGQLLKELILKVGLNSELISLSAIRHSFIHINKV